MLALNARAAVVTPSQTAGPFYPATLPLDQDNDLVSVAGSAGLAKGEVVSVAGRLLDTRARPIVGARVEIWQCDANGRYRHPRERGSAPIDPNFQGYGRTVTGADGGYRFRTIKPVPYPGRAPHIHFAISGAGLSPFTTQMYLAGAPQNDADVLFNRLDPAARTTLLVDFMPGAAEPVGRFDIVLAV